MLWGAFVDGLELRSEGRVTRLRATFPYARETVLALSTGTGPERREMFASRAFSNRIQRGGDIHLLCGHSFDKPLASRAAQTLTVKDSDLALTLEAIIPANMNSVSYVRDFLCGHAAGLVRGISPGFRVLPGGETVEERGSAVLRTITAAELIEISVVTKPAYPDAQIEARNWITDQPPSSMAGVQRRSLLARKRWR